MDLHPLTQLPNLHRLDLVFGCVSKEHILLSFPPLLHLKHLSLHNSGCNYALCVLDYAAFFSQWKALGKQFLPQLEYLELSIRPFNSFMNTANTFLPLMVDTEMVRLFSEDTQLTHLTIYFRPQKDEVLPPAELLSLAQRLSSTPIIVEMVAHKGGWHEFVDITTGRRGGEET
jgi:hypothetical protein